MDDNVKPAPFDWLTGWWVWAIICFLVVPPMEAAVWQLVSGLSHSFLVGTLAVGAMTIVAALFAAYFDKKPLKALAIGSVLAYLSFIAYAVEYQYQPTVSTSGSGTGANAIEKLAAKQAQSAAYDWLRLKPFQITDLRDGFSTIGKYPLSVVWGSDDSAYGLAADVADACHAAQWSVCTPEKLPDSMDVIGMHVHWQAGYQPIAKAIADSMTEVIGVPVTAAPVPESNLKTPVELMVGRKPL
jgi:hypothetical protein